MIINDLPTLKINKLTQKQFDNASMRGELEEQALYLTLDEGNNNITFFGKLLGTNKQNLSASIDASYFEIFQTLEEKNIPRLLLIYEFENQKKENIEFKLFKFETNLITFISTSLNGIILLSINHLDEINVQIEPYMQFENDCVNSNSINSDLLITAGAVWKSLNQFNSIYPIYCNINISNGIITSINLENNSGKALNDILNEAIQAYQLSRKVVLYDTSNNVYLQGLVSVSTDDNNSYRFIFDASEVSINTKNIIYLDSNGFTCYNIKLQSELTIEKTLKENTNNPISSGAVYSALSETRNEVVNIAQGKCKTYTFDNKATLKNWIETASDIDIANLHIGDVFLLRSVGEPDYWWEPASEIALLTEYSEDDIVINGRGAARILETTKVDIQRIESNYAHKQIDLDAIKFKKALKYPTNYPTNGATEYDTENKKICIWSDGVRGAWQDPQPDVLYLIIEE